MAELTKEQLETANEAFCKAYLSQVPLVNGQIEGLRAAAPYLQLPWDEATEEEIKQASDDFRNTTLDRACGLIINKFLSRRNAKLMPKPVDERHNAVMCVLLEADETPTEELASRILATLDNLNNSETK